MAYEKQTWETGQIITAEKLNYMESGIEGKNMTYEKQTWETGQIITAEKLNHMESGIEAAGGSGDISIANVTINVEGEVPANTSVYAPLMDLGGGTPNKAINSGENQLRVMIPTGAGSLLHIDASGEFVYAVIGTIEDRGDGFVAVRGDGVINIGFGSPK